MKIILGSASKWRAEILKNAGYDFTIMPADIDEKQIRDQDPKKLVIAIASAKTNTLLPLINDPVLLITSDQVVTCHGEIFEKPSSINEARHFLHCYNHYPAQTITAVMVTNTQTKQQASGIDIVHIKFNVLSEKEIDALVQQEHIYSCAGGFQIEQDDKLNPFIQQIDGAIDSVKGLPLALLEKLIYEVS